MDSCEDESEESETPPETLTARLRNAHRGVPFLFAPVTLTTSKSAINSHRTIKLEASEMNTAVSQSIDFFIHKKNFIKKGIQYQKNCLSLHIEIDGVSRLMRKAFVLSEVEISPK